MGRIDFISIRSLHKATAIRSMAMQWNKHNKPPSTIKPRSVVGVIQWRGSQTVPNVSGVEQNELGLSQVEEWMSLGLQDPVTEPKHLSRREWLSQSQNRRHSPAWECCSSVQTGSPAKEEEMDDDLDAYIQLHRAN